MSVLTGFLRRYVLLVAGAFLFLGGAYAWQALAKGDAELDMSAVDMSP